MRDKTTAHPADEAAIRQDMQDMQDGQSTKSGKLLASAFAGERNYIAINGMFLPNQTCQDNARVHQRLYDDRRGSVAGIRAVVEVRLNVIEIRLLTPEVAVVYVQSEFRPRSQPEKETKDIKTAAMQKREGEWEIVAFHNAPVQKRAEEDTGLVIHIEGKVLAAEASIEAQG